MELLDHSCRLRVVHSLPSASASLAVPRGLSHAVRRGRGGGHAAGNPAARNERRRNGEPPRTGDTGPARQEATQDGKGDGRGGDTTPQGPTGTQEGPRHRHGRREGKGPARDQTGRRSRHDRGTTNRSGTTPAGTRRTATTRRWPSACISDFSWQQLVATQGIVAG